MRHGFPKSPKLLSLQKAFNCIGDIVKITNQPMGDILSIRAKGRNKHTFFKIGILDDSYNPKTAELTLSEKEFEEMKVVFQKACEDFERRLALPDDEEDD